MKNNFKKYLAIVIGNLIEHYDFALYVMLMPIMAPLFFPHDSSLISLILGYSSFAIAYIARPIGAILFGAMGDKYGTKTALSWSMYLMAIPTLIMAILPTYHQIGIMAPIVLLICRIFQNLCYAGEYSGALLLVFEQSKFSSKFKKASFATSIVCAIGVTGWFLGSFMVFICTKYLPFSYAWRVPFLIGFLLVILVFYTRRFLPDSTKKQISFSPVAIEKLIFQNWLVVLLSASIYGLSGAYFYNFFIFMNWFLPNIVGLSPNDAKLISSASMMLYMIILPMVGYITDKVGQLLMLKCSIIFSLISILPLYWLLMQGNIYVIMLAQILASINMAAIIVSSSMVVPSLFASDVRYISSALSYNLGMCVIAASLPAVSIAMIHSFDCNFLPAFYLLFYALLAMFSLKFLKKL